MGCQQGDHTTHTGCWEMGSIGTRYAQYCLRKEKSSLHWACGPIMRGCLRAHHCLGRWVPNNWQGGSVNQVCLQECMQLCSFLLPYVPECAAMVGATHSTRLSAVAISGFHFNNQREHRQHMNMTVKLNREWRAAPAALSLGLAQGLGPFASWDEETEGLAWLCPSGRGFCPVTCALHQTRQGLKEGGHCAQ